jgi:hypothetical protein
MLTRLLTGRAVTPRDEPIQGGTTIAHPLCSKAWQNPGEHRPEHRVGNLGPGVQLPRALWTLAHEAVVIEDGPHPPVEAEPAAPRCARVILTGRATSVPFTTGAIPDPCR